MEEESNEETVSTAFILNWKQRNKKALRTHYLDGDILTFSRWYFLATKINGIVVTFLHIKKKQVGFAYFCNCFEFQIINLLC